MNAQFSNEFIYTLKDGEIQAGSQKVLIVKFQNGDTAQKVANETEKTST